MASFDGFALYCHVSKLQEEDRLRLFPSMQRAIPPLFLHDNTQSQEL